MIIFSTTKSHPEFRQTKTVKIVDCQDNNITIHSTHIGYCSLGSRFYTILCRFYKNVAQRRGMLVIGMLVGEKRKKRRETIVHVNKIKARRNLKRRRRGERG